MKGPSFNQLLTIGGLGVGAVVLYEIYVNQASIQAAIQGVLNPTNPYQQQGYICPSGGTPSSTGLCPNGQPATPPGQQQGYGSLQSPYGPSSYNQLNQSPFPYNTNVPTGYGGLCSDSSIPNPTTGLCANGTFPSSVSPSIPYGGLPPPFTNIPGGGTLFAPGGGFDGGWGGGGGGWGGGWNSPWNQNQGQNQNQPSGTMTCADGSTPSNGLCNNGQAPVTSLPAGTTTTPSGTVPSTTSTTPTGTTIVTPNPTPTPPVTPAPTTTTTPTPTPAPTTTTTTTTPASTTKTPVYPAKSFVGYQSEGAMMAAQAFGYKPRPPGLAIATVYSTVSPRGGNMPVTSHIFDRTFHSRSPIYMSNIH